MAEPEKKSKTQSVASGIKLALAVFITLIVLIVIFQNTETVRTRLLFATVEMPRALLLIITLLVGFVTGAITAGVVLARRRK